ncbi:tRNA threonylcarbamoyladenosine dehydratase [Nannocystis sp. RBIL2]|uniref:tRNA threonylcarbamoyladenosine dehydratase n=1 Tax=Nannocystis sp. RBIL2 TaxID=2996788 RepID=UPI00226EB91D|nr:tRNA threonylcarbamoyladenosine dehydratase [Nannocystis sp. RBIL2]MCY1070730.1 tRNA threonylcarbamoyladenosine dehydratase [Nannocystis sp. RBIL2]
MTTQFIPSAGLFPARKAAAPAAAPAVADDETSTYKLHRRFDRMGRLVGDPGMQKLFASHVVVVGLGGVGSWAAESLARSGVGKLTIVDFDLICVTNANRQLHAVRGTTGKPKAAVMAERLRLINPRCEVVPRQEFYNAAASDELLAGAPDLVVDAIDNLAAKTHLIATCRKRQIPLVVSGGASGRMDPTQIRIADLNAVENDPFLAATRKLLRKHHEFPHRDKESWGISAVYSPEPARDPLELDYDGGEGFRCVCPQGENDLHGCMHRNVIYGTASFVTGAFGLACASAAVRTLLGQPV